eukprot:208276-Pleurochrysis_carterae.AAC.2
MSASSTQLVERPSYVRDSQQSSMSASERASACSAMEWICGSTFITNSDTLSSADASCPRWTQSAHRQRYVGDVLEMEADSDQKVGKKLSS